MRPHRLAAATAVAICLLGTRLAFAQGYSETESAGGRSVVFHDADLLGANQFDGGGARIHVMPQPKRVLLLRPRTQFVTEMLKSVEAL